MGADRKTWVAEDGKYVPHIEIGDPFSTRAAHGFIKYCLSNYDLIGTEPELPDDPYGLYELYSMYVQEQTEKNSASYRTEGKIIPANSMYLHFIFDSSLNDIDPQIQEITEGYSPRKLTSLKRRINKTVQANRVVSLTKQA